MKAFVKQYYQEFVDNINFPTVIYVYETGKTLAGNKQAVEIYGKMITNVYKISSGSKIKDTTEKMPKSGHQIYYNQRFLNANNSVVEVDCDVCSVCVDGVRMNVIFFEYSFKQLFRRHNKYMLPRIFWVNKARELMGCNEMFRSDIGCSENEKLPHRIDEVLDEESAKKIAEDCKRVLTSKEPLYNMLQLIRPFNLKGYFCKINRIPIYNKNGTVVGVLSVYTHIFNREEYERFYIDTMRENNILNRIICMTDIIVMSIKKDIEYTLDYVSSNVSSFGYTSDQCYKEKLWLEDVASAQSCEIFYKNMHELEQGDAESFNQLMQIKKADQTYTWVNVNVYITKRAAFQYDFQCFVQEVVKRSNILKENNDYIYNLINPQQEQQSRKIEERMEEFYTYYQPVVDPLTHKIIGIEASMRWKSPKYGMIDPEEYLTPSEFMMMVVPLGELYIRRAMEEFLKLKKVAKTDNKLYLKIKTVQLLQPNFVKLIMDTMRQYRVIPEDIVIQVPESILLENAKFMKDIVQSFKSAGVLVMIEYYGALGKNLKRILELPIDLLKLDCERNGSEELGPDYFIEMIEVLNHAGVDVVVSGIETKKQLEYLLLQDVFAFQGNYFSVPKSFEHMMKQVKEMNM